ncbi:MAG: hypothetical protein ACQETH_13850 [Candidatus Rifleibacteriota bacterium]
MAIAASILSQRFIRTRRFTETLEAFFQKSDKKQAAKPQKSELEKDLIELSPYNQIRQMVKQFRQETSVEAELNLSLTARAGNADKEQTTETDPLIDRDLDLMLRMISKDEKEYEQLRGKFEKLMELALSSEKALKGEKVSDKPVTMSDIADAKVGNNAYEFEMKFKKQSAYSETTTERVGISLEELGIKEADPLVLDLAGDGLNLTKAGEGAMFDINADGELDSTAWVQGDDAFLVFDKNQNGKIDDGSELFGDQNGADNGFIELAKHDNNKDGRINRQDSVYKALKLYQDLNGNGKIESNELKSLDQMGIKALNLNFVRMNQKINGNSLVLNGSFMREDGSEGQLADVLLGYRKA